MELLDRYLQAVRFWLPKSQQDDIIAELSANILAQMEDREEQAGRPLTTDEQAAILKQHGSPFLVANRYGGGRRHLIGPLLFPIYRLVIKASLAAAFGIYFLVACVLAITSGANVGTRILDQVLNFPPLVLTIFAWITIVFAGLELAVEKYHAADNWDPRSLPRLITMSQAKRQQMVPRSTSISEFVFGTLFGVWWLEALRSPHLLFGPGADVITFGPAWHTMFFPIALLVLIGPATALVCVVRPDWTRFRSASRVLASVISVAVMLYLLEARSLIVAVSTGGHPEVAVIVNNVFFVSLIVAACFCAAHAVIATLKLLRAPRGRTKLELSR